MAGGEAGGGGVAARAAQKLFSLSGLFAVYKPKGPTSAAVLNLLKERLLAEAGVQTNGNKRKSQVLKIGHGGTLDSAATGVLVVGIGKGTKLLKTILAGSKCVEKYLDFKTPQASQESLKLMLRGNSCGG